MGENGESSTFEAEMDIRDFNAVANRVLTDRAYAKLVGRLIFAIQDEGMTVNDILAAAVLADEGVRRVLGTDAAAEGWDGGTDGVLPSGPPPAEGD